VRIPERSNEQFRCISAAGTRAAGRIPILMGGAVAWVLVAAGGCQTAPPWWDAETRLDERGVLDLRSKPWWGLAVRLHENEQRLVRSQEPGGGPMLLRREKLTGRRSRPGPALVWIIDDDGDMTAGPPAGPGATSWRAPASGDVDSDCYVVDYEPDGLVDRMVDYIDNDRDGRADTMDIRYFVNGELRRAWFWDDHDGDGRMWSLADYEYDGNCFASDPYGDNTLYMNRYDAKQRRWWPISECPFDFYDTDGDGQSEAVVRFSVAPLDFDPATDADYANSAARYEGPFYDDLRRMGVVNVRYGIDVDNESRAERPLHYDLGFNMTGRLPYEFPGMARTNPWRREPKTTICIPHGQTRRIAETYPADQTGFSWREFSDDTIAIGPPGQEAGDRRWEGVFWIWQRRIMHNTGGPTQRWNVRREFRPTFSTRRELYYSRIDRRIHLVGATEGWLEAGYLGGADAPFGEIRTFDTDGDGYFDRWEVYSAGRAEPLRVTTAPDPQVQRLPPEWKRLHEFYVNTVLPEAIAANERLIAAMDRVKPFARPEPLVRALEEAADAGERRYVLDVLREWQYGDLRGALIERNRKVLDGIRLSDLRTHRELAGLSTRAWSEAVLLAEMDQAYGEGRYDDVIELLGRMEPLAGQ